VLQLRVEVEGLAPPVWRRVLVSDRAALLELHDVIQAVYGQDERTMHRVTVDGVTWRDAESAEPGTLTTDAATLDTLHVGPGSRLVHESEGGVEAWRHVVTVEERQPRLVGQRIPACLAAGGASPPEGIDSPGRYRAMREALDRPADPRLGEVREWIPEGFDPEYADLNAINAALAEVRRTAM
jgi:hypothetical protein